MCDVVQTDEPVAIDAVLLEAVAGARNADVDPDG